MHKIYAVIVTYNPDIVELKNSLDKLPIEIKNVILVDNSDDIKSKAKLTEMLRFFKSDKTIKYIDSNGNIGLSKAQNKGVIEAFEDKDCNWILLLDDDSFLKNDSVKKLIEFYEKSKEKKNIGILVTNSVDVNINKGFKYYVESSKGLKIEECKEIEIKSVIVAMASGSLIKREVFEKIGLFDEDFFIDCIDTEYCLRAKKNSYKIFLIGNAILYHKLGDRKKIKILNKEIVPTNHSSFRCYNIYRNNIIFFKKYFLGNEKYFLYQLLVLGNHIFKVILFEKDKVEKMKMIFLGLKDGCKYKVKRG